MSQSYLLIILHSIGMATVRFYIFFLGLAGLFLFTHAFFRFTNAICKNINKTLGDFEYCYIKSTNRTYQYFSLKYNLYKAPVYNTAVTWLLLKRANGYRPFLYNYTVDGCAFLRSKKNNPVHSYFYDFFKTFSNMNHTCPYNGSLVVEKVNTYFLNDKTTNLLPAPRGDYCIESNWYGNRMHHANVKIYATLS